MPDVSIIIPFRGEDPHRQANLTRVLDHLAATGLPLVLGSDGRQNGHPFNRSAAYNDGMAKSPSEVYVFHEADMLIPLDQLARAIDLAREGLGLVVPFTEYHYLPQEGSRLVLSGTAEPEDVAPEWIMGNGRSIGAVNVCSSETMRWVGCWDETLSGHGFDDNAMYHAFETACGETRYAAGPGRHLWHPMAYAPWERGTEASDPTNFSAAELAATEHNRTRLVSYRRATTPEQVRMLTAGGWLP